MKSLFKIFHLLPKNLKSKTSFFVFITFISLLAELLGIGMIIPLLGVLIEGEINILNYKIKSDNLIFLILFIYFFIYLVKASILTYVSYWKEGFLLKFKYYTYNKLFKGYLSQDYLFYSNKETAALSRNIINVSLFADNLSNFTILISEFILIFLFSCLLLFYNFKVTIYVIIFVSIISFILTKLLRNKLIQSGKIMRDKTKEIIKITNESLASIKQIKIDDKADFFIQKFLRNASELIESQKFFNFYMTIPRQVLELSSVSVLCFIIFIMLNMNYSNFQIATYVGILAAGGFRFLPSVNRIINSLNHLKFYASITDGVEDDFKIFSREKNKIENSLIDLDGSLEFQNIEFSYPGAQNKILKNINFKICKNELIGIYGNSGAGKSTLLNIILGLIKPSSGKIILNNKPVNLNNFNWYQKIGLVSQKVFLNNDKIINNIAFGIPEDQVDQKKINEVIKQSELSNFLENNGTSVHDIVGEEASKISGGQAQRIAISRALYKNSEVIIMDEPFSNLDTKVTKKLMQTIKILKKNKIIIIVSHQYETLNFCDKIFKLSNGELKLK